MHTTTESITRTPICSVTITRWEGFEEELRSCRFEGPEACALAGAELRRWARTAPEGGSYDKCDFWIVWKNEDTYQGRYDLQRRSDGDLGAQVRSFLTWVTKGKLGAKEAEDAQRMLDSADLGAW